MSEPDMRETLVDGTLYVIAPVDDNNGRCRTCGCRLQQPGSAGSIWLTPWWDCGGDCVTCMAHVGDPECLASLRHWLDITEVGEPRFSDAGRRHASQTSDELFHGVENELSTGTEPQ